MPRQKPTYKNARFQPGNEHFYIRSNRDHRCINKVAYLQVALFLAIGNGPESKEGE